MCSQVLMSTTNAMSPPTFASAPPPPCSTPGSPATSWMEVTHDAPHARTACRGQPSHNRERLEVLDRHVADVLELRARNEAQWASKPSSTS